MEISVSATKIGQGILPVGAVAYKAVGSVKVEDDKHESKIKKGEQFYLVLIKKKFFLIDVEGKDLYKFEITEKRYNQIAKKHTLVKVRAKRAANTFTILHKGAPLTNMAELDVAGSLINASISDISKKLGKPYIVNNTKQWHLNRSGKDYLIGVDQFLKTSKKGSHLVFSISTEGKTYSKETEKLARDLAKFIGVGDFATIKGLFKDMTKSGYTNVPSTEPPKNQAKIIPKHKVTVPKATKAKRKKVIPDIYEDITNEELHELPSIQIEMREQEIFQLEQSGDETSYNLKRDKARLSILKRAKRQHSGNAAEQKRLIPSIKKRTEAVKARKDKVKMLKHELKQLKKKYKIS